MDMREIRDTTNTRTTAWWSVSQSVMRVKAKVVKIKRVRSLAFGEGGGDGGDGGSRT